MIVAMYLGWIGVVGLICFLAHLRRQLFSDGLAASVFWGTGVAAATSFTLGWSVDGGQVIAHWEAGRALTVAPTVTHVISEAGSILFIFGAGSAMLGFALIALAFGAGG